MSFVHLHNHSQYSILDGKGSIVRYLDAVAEDGQTAFALTDHGTMGGAIELYKQAHKRNLKPIIGCELYVDPGEYRGTQFPLHLTVLARNEKGYRDLITANTIAAKNFYYRPRITIRDLIENELMKDWIVLSGCMSGLVPSPILDRDWAQATTMVEALERNCAQLFIEMMWHDAPDGDFAKRQGAVFNGLIDMATQKGLALALTNDCHYISCSDEELHQSLIKGAGDKVQGIEFDGEGFHFKTDAEMFALAERLDIVDAYENTQDIADACDISIPEVDGVHWYVPDITGGRPEDAIRDVCEVELGMREAYETPVDQAYLDRYAHEMSVLQKSPPIMNSYLVAYDLIEWCRSNGIPAAARGSMAGSLISWLLGITQEDPVKFRLNFNRAVNPARPTIPDFDIDVSSSHRKEVLAYLAEKYHDSRPICAYAEYGPRGASRHVMRLRGVGYSDNNGFSKELDESWALVDFSNLPTVDGVPLEAQIQVFEGLYANKTIHPAGVLLAGPERSLDYEVPMEWIASQKTLVSQYDMYTLKDMGLFKLDILGLNTLDRLEQMYRETGVMPPNEYDDPDVFLAFDAGAVAEIFQMDGYAAREAIKGVGVYNFEDIVAINALVRPGAIQFLKVYRQGEPALMAEYSDLIPVLDYTNGLIIYQEQVMQITGILADFDDAEQDDVKEAIKYFKSDVFNKELFPKFDQRVRAKGLDPTNIWNSIVQFAGYAFNRAHAVSYAGIAYRMMWYKVYHPAAYYAAVFDDCKPEDRMRLIIESANFDVEWHLADVNKSMVGTTSEGNAVYMGLSSIKGIGPATCDAIIEARDMSPGTPGMLVKFETFEDFEARVNKQKCNKGKKEILEAVGAFPWAETGDADKIVEAYGIDPDVLKPEVIKQISVHDSHHLGGFVVGTRPSTIKKGNNAGKEFAYINVMSPLGEYSAIAWPDEWKKAKGLLTQGQVPVILNGRWDKKTFVMDGGQVV